MNLDLLSWALPWHRIWFPINFGTVPAHVLTILWLLGVAGFIARLILMAQMLRFQIMILIGYLGAVVWSLVSQFIDFHLGEPLPPGEQLQSYDPLVKIMDGATQTTGLLGIFAVMWFVSGCIWVAKARESGAEQAAANRSRSNR